MEGFIHRCCRSGVKAIQLRERDMTAEHQLNLAISIKKITKKYSSKLIVNDRLDIAMLSKADGIHSPENGIEAKDVRRINSKLLIGRSVHSIGSAGHAEKKGYDYLIFGPIFRTPSKIKFGKPQGLKKLQEVCKSVRIPVFAVGGIDPERAKKCLNAGAFGVDVIGAIFGSQDLKSTIREFKTVLGDL